MSTQFPFERLQHEFDLAGSDLAVARESAERWRDYPDGFFRWLDNNRAIWRQFVECAREVKKSGRRHFSARVIMENIRWNTLLRDKDVTFKVNNNYTPGLARLAMRVYPELEGMFDLRSGQPPALQH